MLTLLLILLVTGVALAVLLYVASMFLQGFLYTEPSGGLYWQAPAAAGVLTLFFAIWCVLDASAEGHAPTNIPYDTLFRFNPRVDLLKEPAMEVWAMNKDGEKKVYKHKRQNRRPTVMRTQAIRPAVRGALDGVVGVEMDLNGEKQLFKYTPGTSGANGEYVNDQGWVMREYGDGPDGIPSVFRWGRFVMNLFLNFGHFVAWCLCLWLLLRFQLGHAIGLAIVLWLIVTFTVLPILLGYAVSV